MIDITDGDSLAPVMPAEAACELEIAALEFKQNYMTYTAKYRQYITPQEEIDKAARQGESEVDLALSAEIFSNQLVSVLASLQAKEDSSKTKWTRKLVDFVKKVYPIARLCVGLTGSFSQARISESHYNL